MHDVRLRRAPGELVFAILLLAASLFVLWEAYGIAGFSSASSAGAFPMCAAAVMALAALRNLLVTLRLAGPDPERGPLARQFRDIVAPAVVARFVALAVAYVALIAPLGFFIASALFLAAAMWLLGRRRPLLVLAVSTLALAAVYGLFKVVFAVDLPTGGLFQ
jgi:putative tricarboxylic transport membrane protein